MTLFSMGNIRRVIFLVLAAFIAMFALTSWFSLEPPAAKGIDAPADEFSAARAYEHVKELSLRPRPLGSSGHELANNYIKRELKRLGCHVFTQRGWSNVRIRWEALSGHYENIFCFIPGSKPSGTVMLMTHYDSVHNSPGAGDSAAGVGNLLEGMRTLAEKKQKPFDNNLLVFFSDGEEVGLLGASAFIKSGQLEKYDVKIVLNFEGRGSSGPVALFETYNFSDALSPALNAANQPLGNSLMDLLYRFLPRDTDLSAFKKEDLTGLNFAFARGMQHYHHSSDTARNLSRRSLQLEGDLIVQIASKLLEGDLARIKRGRADLVYTDILGAYHVSFPSVWARIACLVTGLFILGLFYTGRPRPLKLLLATVLAGMLTAGSVALVRYAGVLFVTLVGQDGVNNHYEYFFFGAALTLFAITHALFLKLKESVDEIGYGFLVLFLAVLALTFKYPQMGAITILPIFCATFAVLSPSFESRALAGLVFAVVLPQTFRVLLIADSGEIFFSPAVVLAFAFALIHLVFWRPRAEPRQSGIALWLAHAFVFVAGIFLGVQGIRNAQFSNPLRGEFFEVFDGAKFFAVMKNNPLEQDDLFKYHQSDAKMPGMGYYLSRWGINKNDYKVYELEGNHGNSGGLDPKINVSHSRMEGHEHFVIDVPPQDYSGLTIFFEEPIGDNLENLRVNGFDFFRVDSKKLNYRLDLLYSGSTHIATDGYRLEFDVSAQNYTGQFVATAGFTKNSYAPVARPLGKMDEQKQIFSSFSNTLYVFKKIVL